MRTRLNFRPAGPFRARYLPLLPVLATLLVAGSCQAPAEQQGGVEEWRFAIEETIGSVQHEYALRFKELIEERTEGQVKVTVYTYGTLGTSDQLTEQLQLGAVQFAMASPGHLGKLIPEVQVFLLHFVLSDDERVNQQALRDPELIGLLDDLYATKGMALLSAFSEGWQVWTTRRPVREPADFRGQRIRVMTSPLLLAAYRAYGASPTPLPYAEVYSALQLNMVDGQVNPVFAIQEMSFHEVTDWMIFAGQAPFIATAVASRDFFDGLRPERQQLVRETIDELDEFVFQAQRDFNRERLEIIRSQRPDMEILHLTDEERERFRQASLPVRDLYLRMGGPRAAEVLDRLLAAVARAEEQAESAS